MTTSRNQTTTKSSQSSSCSLTYTLLLYRDELNRSKARHIKLSKTKLYLTDRLISTTMHNIAGCSVKDLQDLSRGVLFKKKLKLQMHRMRKLQQLGVKNPDPRALSTTSV